MAQAKKKTKAIKTTVSAPQLPARIIKAVPAVFVEPPAQDDTTFETPDAVSSEFELEDAPGGMTPTVDFHSIGAFVFGDYRGARTLSIGGRSQNMYDLEVDGKIVAVWGSTILDSRLLRLDPKIGEGIYIQYCGDVETGRKLNPAKNFRVARMKPKQK